MLNIVKQKLLVLMQNLQSQQQLPAKILDNAITFRQMRMIAMRKTLTVSIYSVATINKIDVNHKYMEVHLNGMPIKMLVDCGSNVTIVTAEVFNKIKFKGHKLASSAEKLMDCQSKEIPVLGEYSVEAQIGKDKFREKVLITKLDKCLLGNSFITKIKNFD